MVKKPNPKICYNFKNSILNVLVGNIYNRANNYQITQGLQKVALDSIVTQ